MILLTVRFKETGRSPDKRADQRGTHTELSGYGRGLGIWGAVREPSADTELGVRGRGGGGDGVRFGS